MSNEHPTLTPEAIKRLRRDLAEAVESDMPIVAIGVKSLAAVLAAVGKLPVTADGVVASHNMVVYVGSRDKHIARLYSVGTPLTMYLCGGLAGDVAPDKCYSTQAAARAAKESSNA